MLGKVKFFSIKKGFGFIVPDDGSKDIYFNKASLRRDREYDPIDGDPLEYQVRESGVGPIAHHIEQLT